MALNVVGGIREVLPGVSAAHSPCKDLTGYTLLGMRLWTRPSGTFSSPPKSRSRIDDGDAEIVRGLANRSQLAGLLARYATVARMIESITRITGNGGVQYQDGIRGCAK